MKNDIFKKQVKQFGGFIENGIARFPSVHAKEQFLKARAEHIAARQAKNKSVKPALPA